MGAKQTQLHCFFPIITGFVLRVVLKGSVGATFVPIGDLKISVMQN